MPILDDFGWRHSYVSEKRKKKKERMKEYEKA
jgi:hypothetical protein